MKDPKEMTREEIQQKNQCYCPLRQGPCTESYRIIAEEKWHEGRVPYDSDKREYCILYNQEEEQCTLQSTLDHANYAFGRISELLLADPQLLERLARFLE